MSGSTLLLDKPAKVRRRHSVSRFQIDQATMSEVQPPTTAMLRDMGFVLHLTRMVKQAILGEAPRFAAAAN